MGADGGATGRVIVAGSINLDLVLHVPRLPAAGETVTGGTLTRHHGGKGANQAVAAARAGARAHLIGAVGDDGQASLDALTAAGVDISAVARLHGHQTGHAVVIVDDAGENQIAVAPGANTAVAPGHVGNHLSRLGLTTRDVVVLSFELADPPLLAAADAARRAGALLLVNPAPARACDAALLRGAVITPNRHELAAMLGGSAGTRGSGGSAGTRGSGGFAGTGGTAREQAAHAAALLARQTGGYVIATLGADGALLADAGGVAHFHGHRVTPRDTTGAGDALTGVLAASLAAGAGLRQAVRRAVAAGALAVTRVGAREGAPTAAEIDALLAQTPCADDAG